MVAFEAHTEIIDKMETATSGWKYINEPQLKWTTSQTSYYGGEHSTWIKVNPSRMVVSWEMLAWALQGTYEYYMEKIKLLKPEDEKFEFAFALTARVIDGDAGYVGDVEVEREGYIPGQS